jgi:pyruvate dehydrogenase E1 component alpha subunit|tara:strand:+ start:201 stop:1127 length:927 start_codon:yes stop_codon:yes gene_type:complete
MLRIRLVEEAIADRYSEQEMRCPVHLSIGQEAAAVGACAPLMADDVIVSNHRSHSHYLAKGGNLEAMLGEIYGRVTGCCGGRGGSMHLFDARAGVLASVPIVASTVPLAVGAALTFQQRQRDCVSVAFLGDAATEEGVFHESLNFASLHTLPVIFFVENNLYSVYTPLHDRQPDRSLTDYAVAHAIPSEQVDGNDVEAVLQSMTRCVRRARAGKGPTLLVVDTYRWREHCGPNYDNDLGYRSENEYEKWRRRCPIEMHRAQLANRGTLTPELETRMTAEIQSEIDAAFETARSAPFPDPKTAGLKVYA